MANAAKRASLVIMAISEMVTFVVTIGTVAFFISEAGDTDLTLDIGFYGREEFVLFASAVGFFVALFSMIVAILGAQENSHWAATMATLHAFGALVLLVSASLLAKTTMTYDSKDLCKQIKKDSNDARCYQLIIGLSFAFVSMVLFIGDTTIYVVTLAQHTGISFVNMDNLSS